ncbi:hypothetical protein SLA2020_492290 [Shorea laevis]
MRSSSTTTAPPSSTRWRSSILPTRCLSSSPSPRTSLPATTPPLLSSFSAHPPTLSLPALPRHRPHSHLQLPPQGHHQRHQGPLRHSRSQFLVKSTSTSLNKKAIRQYSTLLVYSPSTSSSPMSTRPSPILSTSRASRSSMTL